MNPNSVREFLCENWSDGSSKLHDLERFLDFVDGFLTNEKTYFEEEAHPDLELEFLPLFAATFPPILHSSFIISVSILLEQEMRGFTKLLLLAIGSELRYGDFSGSVLERFRTVATKLASLPFDEVIVPWEDIVAVFEIRNCLVHANGSLAEFTRSATIIGFVDRHQMPSVDAEVLRVDILTSRRVLAVASTFLDGIYRVALNRFPKT